MRTIEEAIANLLKENTGSPMGDHAGYAGGRHWEKNQGRNFASQPSFVVEGYTRGETDEAGWAPIQNSDLGFTINVYHYLVSRLRVTSESENENALLQTLLQADPDDLYEIGYMQQFATSRNTDTDNYCIWLSPLNTYNGECLLSQTLQFSIYDHEGTSFIVLQIHGGADVRGGYTTPQVFEIANDERDGFVTGYIGVDATAQVDGETVRWNSESGYGGSFRAVDDSDDVEVPELELEWHAETNTFRLAQTHEAVSFYPEYSL
jgi:hypothetical protein